MLVTEKSRKHNEGFLLVELMLSFILFALALSAVSALYWSEQSALLTEPFRLQAFSIAKNTLASVQAQAGTDFDSVQPYSFATSSQDTAYAVDIKSSLSANDQKYITVTVSWPGSVFVRAGGVSLGETVIDTTNLEQNPTCHLSNAWFSSTPRLGSHGSINIGTSSTSTGITVRHDILYLSADSPNKGEKDLYIVNTKNKDTPVILSSLDTGPGLEAITLDGQYLYAANASINAQLQIIDVSSSTQPVLITSFKLPGNYSDNGMVGASIFYRNHLIYLGTRKSDIAELHIVDVSDVFHPKEVGSFEMNTTIHRIVVHDHLIYVASPDNNEIRIIDASDLSHLREVGDFNAQGSSGSGQALYQDGNTLYLGRTEGNNELYILDASSTTPSILGSKSLNASIEDILVFNGLAFLVTTDFSKDFQVWNVANKSQPTLVASVPLLGRSLSVACDGNSVYVALPRAAGFFSISPM